MGHFVLTMNHFVLTMGYFVLTMAHSLFSAPGAKGRFAMSSGKKAAFTRALEEALPASEERRQQRVCAPFPSPLPSCLLASCPLLFFSSSALLFFCCACHPSLSPSLECTCPSPSPSPFDLFSSNSVFFCPPAVLLHVSARSCSYHKLHHLRHPHPCRNLVMHAGAGVGPSMP